MKTYTLGLSLMALVFTACNNTADKKTTAVIAKDSVATTLTDLAGVTDIKKLLCQDWENKEDADDAALSGSGEGLEMPFRGFSFFDDGTLTESPRDKIKFGKWTLSEPDKIISIDYTKGGKAKYKIAAIGAKQMILMNTADKKQDEYRAGAKAHKTIADDPFYITNNQWRIKPAKPETADEIKLRTEQCVLFYAKYLADNAARGGNIISFTGLPACFKWYRGGVSIIAKDKLENRWLNCYYNKEQAMEGYALLDKIISKKYKWDKEQKNWVKQSADVVQQMYDTLKVL